MEPVTYCVKKIFNRFFEFMKPVTSMIIQNTLIVNNIFYACSLCIKLFW